MVNEPDRMDRTPQHLDDLVQEQEQQDNEKEKAMRRKKQSMQYMYYFTYYNPADGEQKKFPESEFEYSELVVEELGRRPPLETKGPRYEYDGETSRVKSISFAGTFEADSRDEAWSKAVSRVWDTGNWADEYEDDRKFFRISYDYERRSAPECIRTRESLRVALAPDVTHEWTGKPISKYKGNRILIRQWREAPDIPSAWAQAVKYIKDYKRGTAGQRA